MVTLHSHATRLGVLDIGSNTVHMLIVDAAPGARPEPEASTKSTIRLMQYLKDDGSIKKAGTEALLSAVEKAMKLAEEYEITQLLVLATSALREAPNGGKILRKIEEAIGQPVTVLSGVDEARLTFLAARRWYGWVVCSSSTSAAARSKWPWAPTRTRPSRCPFLPELAA